MRTPFIARILLGAIFLTTGLNGFFNFLPMQPMPDRAGEFMEALGASGYFFPFLKTLETICGLLLLNGAFVPLALVVLAPIVSNILMFHFFLAPGGLFLPFIIAVLMIYLSFVAKPYSSVIKQLFHPMKKKKERIEIKSVEGMQPL